MSFSSPDLLLNGLSLSAFQFNCQQPKRSSLQSMSLPRLHTQMAPRHHPYVSYPQQQQQQRAANNRKWSAYPPQQPAMLCFPPSPSDSISSAELSPIHSSSSASQSPLFHFIPHHQPQVTFVQCTAPLLAPKPLPYHSPRFLHFDELPEIEEDLSHPPYLRRPQKRKREQIAPADDNMSSKDAKRSRNGSSTGPAPKPAVRSLPRSRLPRSHAPR